MALIEMYNIEKDYKSDEIITPALKKIDLRINEGEYVAIMGASGSGKTTLLNILGCMDIPTRGRYLFDNRDISKANEMSRAQIRGKKIAFIFQNFALINDYTVYENVELPLIKLKLSRKERCNRVNTALRLIGIDSLSGKKAMHLSGGQKQRAAVARAIVCGADVILADEPTGALDSKTGEELMNVFTELNSLGKTVILITHDCKVADYANRLIMIKDGEIIDDKVC